MVDINALRGISSSQNPTNEEEKSLVEREKEKQKQLKQAQIEKGLQRARPDLQGAEKENAKEKLMRAVANEEKIPEDMEDFAFQVALSLQTIENETTPKNEYFYWIEDTKDIIKKMNDGEITDKDLDEREDFLENLNQRETEMRVYIDLYRASNSPKAKEKLEELQLKLAKLQQLRSAILATTKSREEAEYNRSVEEEEKRLAEAYQRMLEEQRTQEFYSDLEYKAGLLLAQNLIQMAELDEREKENQLRRMRYQNYMKKRADDLLYLNKMAPNPQLRDYYGKNLEMMNLVKVANTSKIKGHFDEEEQIKRNVCGAVLEYRRRDKAVPEKVLYKLGVKSFVPDYSMSEELLQRKLQNESKNDIIARINELRGRQTQSNVSISLNRGKMQSFDMNRYLALKKSQGLVNG